MRFLSLIILASLASTGTGYARKLTEIQKQDLGDINILQNSGFENGQARWTNSGSGAFAIETSGSNLAVGAASASWDAATASDSLTSRQVSILNGMVGQCQASFLYKGGDSNITAQVIDGSLNVLASKQLSASTKFLESDLYFSCPESGTIALQFVASADAAVIYLDQMFLGKRGRGRGALAVSPTVYELAKQNIGSVGAVDNAKQALSAVDFSGAASATSFYSLTSANDDSTNGRDFTNNNVTFDHKGFYGRDNVAYFNGATDTRLTRTGDSFFNFNKGSGTYSMGGWFYTDWELDSGVYALMQVGDVTGENVNINFLGSTNEIRLQDQGTSLDFKIPTGRRWVHVAAVYSGGTKYLYYNGQLAGSNAAGTNAITASQASIGDILTGAFANEFLGRIQDVFFSTEALSASQINAIYSRRYEGKQIKAGHVLTDDSFPQSLTSASRSFYNLGDVSDDSSNGRDLTNIGSTPFTGLDIFGQSGIADFDGSSQYLRSSDPFFNVGNNPFAIGGWFVLKDISSTNQMISQSVSGSDRGVRLQSTTTDIELLVTNAANPTSYLLTISANLEDNNILAGQWNHYIAHYDGFGTVSLYINGVLAANGVISDIRSTTGNEFNIGAVDGGAAFGNIKAQDIIYVKGKLDALDILKLYSAKIPHSKAIDSGNQRWYGDFYKGDNESLTNEFNQDWLLDKTAQDIYIETGLSPEDQIALKMQNQSMSATAVPVQTFTTGKLTAAPTFPIAHGLPCKPKDFYVLAGGQSLAGEDDKRYDLCSVDNDNINCSLGSLTIDASHEVEIVASCVSIAAAIDIQTDPAMLMQQQKSSSSVYVGAGQSYYKPDAEILAGHQYTIDGIWNTVGVIKGDGILAGSGTVKALDAGQNGEKAHFDDIVVKGDASFEGDVQINGVLSGGSPLKVKEGITDETGLGPVIAPKGVHIIGDPVNPATTFGSLIVEDAGQAVLNLIAGDTGLSTIYFGDSGSFVRGGIVYDHNTEDMQFRTANNTTKFLIKGSGGVDMKGGADSKRVFVGGIYPDTTAPQDILTVATNNTSGVIKIRFTSSRNTGGLRGAKSHEMLTYWYSSTKGAIVTDIVRAVDTNAGDPTFAWSGNTLTISPSSANGGGAWIMEIDVAWRSGSDPTIDIY